MGKSFASVTSRSSSEDALTPEKAEQARRAAMSSFFGGALEYYDFYIYTSAAALVFPSIFFHPDMGGTKSILASLATLGVGYVARPIGALVFGHVGDRWSRRRVLVITLMLMGIATTLVGVLPTYSQIGVLAPVLLICMRLVQGFSAGAETTGASTISLEAAPPGKRATYTAWTQNGNYAGFVLASLAFLPVTALPRESMLSWGWRVPFLASILVALVAFLIRRKLAEPEVFQEQARSANPGQAPLLLVFKSHPWQVMRTALVLLQGVVLTLVFSFGLAYATQPQFGIEIPYSTMLWVAIVSNASALVTHPLFGWLSDRIGRRPVMITGLLGSAAMGFAYFAAVTDRNLPAVFVCGVLLTGGMLAATTGVFQTFIGEQFNARVRMTGTSVGFQVGMIVGGFAPTMAAGLVEGPNWVPVATLLAIAVTIAAITVYFSPETHRVPLRQLGRRVD
ncbi:MFS transporter [Saccharopolyspora sp. NPDC049426]|uniref:MFS transporter n=1 Tax=Saccharopolyspora sp. NPDC049426 TaxID=3155652 RepID=UPI003448448E